LKAIKNKFGLLLTLSKANLLMLFKGKNWGERKDKRRKEKDHIMLEALKCPFSFLAGLSLTSFASDEIACE
jgi:hypothetical protein